MDDTTDTWGDAMTEPANDTYLLDAPIPIAPLCDLIEWNERGLIVADMDRECWRVAVPLRIILQDAGLADLDGPQWTAHRSGYLDVCQGYEYDGASGPACDTPGLVIAALVHDIACTVCPGGRRAIPGYLARQAVYRRIALRQGTSRLRSWTHWAGLMMGNWAWR